VNRVVSAATVGFGLSLFFLSCGGSKASGPPSGLHQRVFVSQTVSAGGVGAGLMIINAANDTVPRASEIGAGVSPSFIVPSPNLATFLVYDAAPTVHAVQVVNTQTEANGGSITLPGPTSSIVLPLPAGPAFAAVPSAQVNGASPGAVEVLSLSTGAISDNISVPGVQTVVSNSNGTILLAFNPDTFDPVTDTNVVTVVIPANINTGNPVTKVIPGFDKPVTAVINGTTAYVLNCGAECGGVQASVQAFDLGSFTLLGPAVSVNGATVGMLNGSTLYVAGKGTPTGPMCASIPSAAATAATYCGTLDLVNVTTMQDPNFNNPATEIAITDGDHTLMGLSLNGQLFIGARTCTNVGNVANPGTSEVRGCLAIYNTNTGAVVIPPDNGDVTGFQGFTSRNVEYVVQGGNLRIYDTTRDVLQSTQLNLIGVFYDVKAADFF
jgi:hypothetical protein